MPMDDGSDLSVDPQELATCIEEVEARIAELEGLVEAEEAKRERYRVRCGGMACVKSRWSSEGNEIK